MRTMKSLKWSALVATGAAAGLLLPGLAGAHGIWFAQRAKQIAVIYGIGADDLEAVKRQPNMESVQAWDADLNPVSAQLRTAGSLVSISISCPDSVSTRRLTPRSGRVRSPGSSSTTATRSWRCPTTRSWRSMLGVTKSEITKTSAWCEMLQLSTRKVA